MAVAATKSPVASVVNALSTELDVKVARQGKEYYMDFDHGHVKTSMKVINDHLAEDIHGTTVHFKPDPAIYRLLLDRYSLNPEECVFLDDIQKNLDAAKAFGIHTILFRSMEQAREELRALRVE